MLRCVGCRKRTTASCWRAPPGEAAPAAGLPLLEAARVLQPYHQARVPVAIDEAEAVAPT